ncbi:MAG: alpha/beta fold hydrolase [Bacteroidia bacterium]
MMRVLVVLMSLLFLNTSISSQSLPKPKAISRPLDYEFLAAPDSLGNRAPLKTPKTERTGELKLPYPVVFVHGLNSNSATWDTTTAWMEEQYDFSFGGRFDFCLNYDEDYNKANKYFNTSDADMALFTSTIVPGDYYFVNFDVGTNGLVSPGYWDDGFVRSNQSAIAKQGYAVKWAIESVLQQTGRDKVILFGHSMGGLASREYIQNPENWQSDGKHHVAKLVTTGTPHGGSNSTAYGLGFLAGLDEETEAVRDLRRTYYYSLDSGVYLYGGMEVQGDTTMDDNLGVDFYNVDVNCDGTEGQLIVGLNKKTLVRNIDFTCIIGNCDGCWAADNGIGDGVVNNYCANLKNYYPDLDAEVFFYNASALAEIHTVLPTLNFENMLGLDEPDKLELAYTVDTSINYTGFITPQAKEPEEYDYDYYEFTMPYNGNINITVNNSVLSNFTLCVFDTLFNSIGFVEQSFGSTIVHFNKYAPQGKYYIRISAIADENSFLYPYNFSIETSPATSVDMLSMNTLGFNAYPNPASDKIWVNLGQQQSFTNHLELVNVLGELIERYSIKNNVTEIDISNLEKGIYFLRTNVNNKQIVKRFIKE